MLLELLNESPFTAFDFRWNGAKIDAIFQCSKPYKKVSHEFDIEEFEEILKELIEYQKCALDTFKILDSDLNPEDSDEGKNRILNSLINSLKSKKPLFQVERFSITLTNVNQAISIAKYLDPTILGRIDFIFGVKKEETDIGKALEFVGWRNWKRLRIIVTIFKNAIMDLDEMKKLLLHFPHFQEVIRIYKACSDHKISIPLQDDVDFEPLKFAVEFPEFPDHVLNETKSSLFQVQKFHFEPENVDQAMKFIQLLDPLVLEEIKLKFLSKIVDLEPIFALKEWKTAGKRLNLVLKLKKLTVDNMLTMNKIQYYFSTFRKVTVHFENFREDGLNVMDMKYLRKNPEKKFEFLKLSRIDFLYRRRVIKSNLDREICSKVMENPLIMRRITKGFDFYNLQPLRKVSTGIRNCMDHVKTDPAIRTYWLELKSTKRSTVCFDSKKFGSYETTETGWRVNGKMFDSGDVQSVILQDFEQNLKYQKTPLKILTLYFTYDDIIRDSECDLETMMPGVLKQMTSDLLKRVQEILKRRKYPLRVEQLKMVSVTSEDVMKVLPFIDAGFLKQLEIRDSYSEYNNRYQPFPESLKIPYDLKDIVNTEQWKSVKIFKCQTVPVPTPIQQLNLCHLSEIHSLKVQTISNEDVAFLKENLMETSDLPRFRFEFSGSTINGSLHELLGKPADYYPLFEFNYSYYAIPNSTVFLCLYIAPSVISIRIAKSVGQ